MTFYITFRRGLPKIGFARVQIIPADRRVFVLAGTRSFDTLGGIEPIEDFADKVHAALLRKKNENDAAS